MSSQPHFLVDVSLPRFNILFATKKIIQGLQIGYKSLLKVERKPIDKESRYLGR